MAVSVRQRRHLGRAQLAIVQRHLVDRAVYLLDGVVLVDTGATSLALPGDAIAQLGLPLLDEVLVETAAGVIPARRFRDADLTVEGRSGSFECIELPGGTEPLLGVVPLQALGVMLDLPNERIELLPDDRPGTYLKLL